MAQCPICDGEFEDATAVQRHKLIQHGIADDDAGSDGNPGAAGWYEDPSNPLQRRWWDGTQWTARTDRGGNGGAAPVAPAAHSTRRRARREETWEPPVTSRPSEPTFRKPASTLTVVAVGIVVALAVVIAIVLLAPSNSPHNSTVPTLAPVPTSTGGGPATGLAAGVLAVADLGPGWTAYPPAHPLKPEQYTAGPCGSTLWSSNKGGYEASFVNGSSTEAAHGAVVNIIYEAASVAAAAQQRQLVISPGFLPCLQQTAAAEARSLFPATDNVRIGTVTANPFTLNLPATTTGNISSQAYVLTIPVIEKGTSQTITDDAVQMFAGPYEATLDVSWGSAAPLTQQIVQLQAASVATHLAGLLSPS